MTAPSTYQEFLARKLQRDTDHGRDTSTSAVHPLLHGWQQEIVAWACQKGRAAIWADTGLGKTLMQLEWVRLMTPDTARSLLEARETLWCVAHSSTGATDPEGRGVCWFFMFAEALRVHAGSTTEHLPCRLVPARLVFEKEQK